MRNAPCAYVAQGAFRTGSGGGARLSAGCWFRMRQSLRRAALTRLVSPEWDLLTHSPCRARMRCCYVALLPNHKCALSSHSARCQGLHCGVDP